MHNFDDGPNPLLFGNKAENQRSLQDKAAIFTIEDSHGKHGKHRSNSGKIHDNDERCNCQSPNCYCSVGDGRQTEMTIRHSEPTQEERFYVYLLTDIDGSRELVGQIYLTVDSFLSETRRAIDRDRDLSELIEGREYRFLDENLDAIPNYQESTMDLERVFPSQGINIQFLPLKAPTPKPAPPPRPKIPAYVGPLGICTAADCTKAAKLKCLDCRNVAYCSKHCMKDGAKDHRRNCFKPAWRL